MAHIAQEDAFGPVRLFGFLLGASKLFFSLFAVGDVDKHDNPEFHILFIIENGAALARTKRSSSPGFPMINSSLHVSPYMMALASGTSSGLYSMAYHLPTGNRDNFLSIYFGLRKFGVMETE